MKTMPLRAAACAAFLCFLTADLSAQSTSLEGYSARLSWPVVEAIIPQRPEIKEFLADGDYVTYVMVYHPAAAALVRRVQPEGVLEENFEFPELRDKAQDALKSFVEKNPDWKERLFDTAPSDAKVPVYDAERREREAALRPQFTTADVPTALQAVDTATLQAKLADLKALRQNAANEGERAALDSEIRLLENALHARKP